MASSDLSQLEISRETLPGSQVALTIGVPADEVERTYEKVIGKLSQKVKIQGFRPGKAPRTVVEARLGPQAIREEAIEALVPEVVNRALSESGVDPIDRPRVDVIEFERGKPARFTATVSVMPKVELPDLESIRVESPHTEVTDEMVDRRVEELLDSQASLEPVERPVQEGDVIVADLDVSTGGREVPSAARRAMEVEVKEGVLIPELRVAVVGKSTDEIAEAEVEMPEDAVDGELAGKRANLRLTVRGVKQKNVPRLNDRTAETISNGEQKTALELKIAVRKDLEEQARKFDDLAHEQQVLQAVVEGAKVEVPATLVDHEVAHQLEDLEQRIQRQGLRLDRYFAYSGTTAQEWAAKARPDAESRLRVDMVLGEATRKLDVNPTTEEVYGYLMSEAAKDEELKDQLDTLTQNKTAVEYFRHRLTRLKTLERLVEIASGTKPAPKTGE
ncbi:MAG: trigger factor [Candidatus Dormibacteraeota bacterium]|nr:trigger factor [Candidatus Dormibacteraeota bacterium]